MKMTFHICTACGMQFDESSEPPSACPICEDDRQFVPPSGQVWTHMTALRSTHDLIWTKEAKGIHCLQISPDFAIGQRAFLIEGPDGNILWDCLSLLDESSISRIAVMGGLAAIAISHPHFYSSMMDWSSAFGDVPVYIHNDDREWVQRSGPALSHWVGEVFELNQATLVRCGGHFAGSSVLHCPWLEDGKGALFVGDTMQVTLDRRYVSFMRSFPNLLPLSGRAVKGIGEALRPFRFEAIYGGFSGRTIKQEGSRVIERSIQRYIHAIEGGPS
jgi:glyoxylase-like metal-dependent hydrolase (beta-lactamase superfamily II)